MPVKTRSISVLLDCDGVLSDFVRACGAITKTQRTLLAEHDLFSPEILGEEAPYIEKRVGLPGFAEHIPPCPGAKRLVTDLRTMGCDLTIVTAPWDKGKTWHADREEWLRRQMGFVHGDVLFVPGKQKYRVHGDVFVDDLAISVYQWCLAHPNGIGIVVLQPWSLRSLKKLGWDKGVPKNARHAQSLSDIPGFVNLYRRPS